MLVKVIKSEVSGHHGKLKIFCKNEENQDFEALVQGYVPIKNGKILHLKSYSLKTHRMSISSYEIVEEELFHPRTPGKVTVRSGGLNIMSENCSQVVDVKKGGLNIIGNVAELKNLISTITRNTIE